MVQQGQKQPVAPAKLSRNLFRAESGGRRNLIERRTVVAEAAEQVGQRIGLFGG